MILFLGTLSVFAYSNASESEDGLQTTSTSANPHSSLLNDTMWDIADSVRMVFYIIQTEDIGVEAQHRLVLRELNILQNTMEGVRESDEIRERAIPGSYLDLFLEDVIAAREYAQRQPQDYYPASRLIKSCLICHENI